jgi:serine phosphatase RsbU (regulator of sigma subunit)
MTDGIYEAWSPQNELLGNERVLALLDRHRLDLVTDILTTVKQTVTDWQSGKEAKDDQTVVLVRKT